MLVLALAVGLLVGRQVHRADRSAGSREDPYRPWSKRARLGFLAFVVIFSLGELVHIPGMVFVGAALLIYGKVMGFAAAFVGAVISVCISFVLVRAVGGKALTAFEKPFIKKNPLQAR